MVDDMRSRLTLSSSTGKNAATIVTIKFRSDTANTAAQVTNEFVTLVLQDNVAMRTSRASDTLEFFEQERDRLGGDLDAQSAEILKFQTENTGSLPQDLDPLQTRRATLINDRAIRDRELQSLRDQRTQVVDIFERTGNIQSASVAQLPEEIALEAAERQLADAKLIYSEQNPKLRVMIARVDQARQALTAALSDTSATGVDPTEQVSSAQSVFESQLAQIDSNIQFRLEEITRIDQELEDIGEKLSRIPSNTITLDKLQRDYANIQAQYTQTASRLSQAATGERIELLSKGQRISVLEQATPPDRPTKPNRVLISAAGLGIGMASGVGLVFLMELLNSAIRRPEQITDKLGITPLAVLPYLRTDREVVARRMVLFSIIAFFVILVPLLLFAVHNLYFPLDTLIEPFANRFGFSVNF
ncbi:GNVR domain-containing protein [Pseudoruegeria sp. SK021]|uniref:GumC family protein n=1 Tax=Pseudoruegeria sp. SK021 TaxID=1933035 RepID=UPI001F0B0DEF|nr:GNVR domain-containing protein [Pseudoruegeria sp. SK021]